MAWYQGPNLRTPRDDFGLAAVGGKLYALGGMSGARGRAVRTMEVLDPSTGVWEMGPVVKTPRYSLAAVAVGESIYVMGGDDGATTFDLLERFDPSTGAWTRLADAPTTRYALASTALERSIYVAGGRSEVRPLATFERYDVDTDSWSRLPDMPTARAELTLAALGGRLYAIGGSVAPDGPDLTTVHIYDPASAAWSPGPPLPEPIVRGVAVATSSALHVIVKGTHLVLDAGATSWRREAPTPTSRKGSGAALLGGDLYVVGGCTDAPRDLPHTERFSAR